MDGESATLRNIRRLLLLVVAGGVLAMAVDLLLIGHYEDTNQAIPLVVAGATVASLGWVAIRPGVAALRMLQFVMLCLIGTGLIGITLHFQANAEFQHEIDPAISARDLFWKVTKSAAPPALAPGIMAQLGLLGLVYTYKHPALRIEGRATFKFSDQGRSRTASTGDGA